MVSAAYLALIPFDIMAPRADTDAKAVRWGELDYLPPLAFDHADIIKGAATAFRARSEAFGATARPFTLSDFQDAHEAVMGEVSDRRNLHKRVLASGLIESTGELERGHHRPARLYRAVATPSIQAGEEVV